MWQLGRLLALVVWVVLAYVKRRQHTIDGYEMLQGGGGDEVLTRREMALAGVVFLDVCIFAAQMTVLVKNGLAIFHEQCAQVRRAQHVY